MVTAAVIMGLSVAVVPALAADDTTITASDFEFTPAEVTIRVGDTVTFAIAEDSASFHNFDFGAGEAYPDVPSPPGPAWDGQRRTFAEPGEYAFVCDAHGFMTGTVTVLPASATPTPTPTPTPSQGGTLEIRTLEMAGAAFCTKRGRRCRKPGVRVRIDISRAAEVTGTLARRPPRGKGTAKRFGRVRFGTVAPGTRTLVFSRTSAGNRLTAGRYTLKIAIAGSDPRSLRFRVRR